MRFNWRKFLYKNLNDFYHLHKLLFIFFNSLIEEITNLSQRKTNWLESWSEKKKKINNESSQIICVIFFLSMNDFNRFYNFINDILIHMYICLKNRKWQWYIHIKCECVYMKNERNTIDALVYIYSLGALRVAPISFVACHAIIVSVIVYINI